MQKIVINTCYGGFSISDKAVLLYAELSGFDLISVRPDRWAELVGPDYYLVATKEELESMNEVEKDATYFGCRDINRDDEILVEVVERLGEEANGRFAELKVVEIPDDVEWTIEEYDGREWIAEVHRTWS